MLVNFTSFKTALVWSPYLTLFRMAHTLLWPTLLYSEWVTPCYGQLYFIQNGSRFAMVIFTSFRMIHALLWLSLPYSEWVAPCYGHLYLIQNGSHLAMANFTLFRMAHALLWSSLPYSEWVAPCYGHPRWWYPADCPPFAQHNPQNPSQSGRCWKHGKTHKSFSDQYLDRKYEQKPWAGEITRHKRIWHYIVNHGLEKL